MVEGRTFISRRITSTWVLSSHKISLKSCHLFNWIINRNQISKSSIYFSGFWRSIGRQATTLSNGFYFINWPSNRPTDQSSRVLSIYQNRVLSFTHFCCSLWVNTLDCCWRIFAVELFSLFFLLHSYLPHDKCAFDIKSKRTCRQRLPPPSSSSSSLSPLHFTESPFPSCRRV